MTRIRLLPCISVAIGLALAAVGPAMARPDRDRDSLREAAAQGHVMPLNRLVAEVQSREPYKSMTYLGGPQFDSSTMRYALKFLDGTRLIIVYVDARDGRIVGRHP